MQKAEALALGRVEGIVEAPSRIEQHRGAHQIGVHEGPRVVDGAVDVGLGGKVDHRDRAVAGKQDLDQVPIGNVAFDEH